MEVIHWWHGIHTTVLHLLIQYIGRLREHFLEELPDGRRVVTREDVFVTNS